MYSRNIENLMKTMKTKNIFKSTMKLKTRSPDLERDKRIPHVHASDKHISKTIFPASLSKGNDPYRKPLILLMGFTKNHND